MHAALFVLCLMAPACLHAATISGTVKDPSGAVIPEARIEIAGGDLAQTMVVISDGVGKFASAELKPGKYALRVSKDGFESLDQTVDLRGSAELQLTLAIARQQVGISVSGR